MTKDQALTLIEKEYPGLVPVDVKEIEEGFVILLDKRKNKKKNDILLVDPILVYHSGKTIPYNPFTVDNYPDPGEIQYL